MENGKTNNKKRKKKRAARNFLLLILIIACILFVVLAWKTKSGQIEITTFQNVAETETTEPQTSETVVTETETETLSRLDTILDKKQRPSSYSINVEAVLQNPELPTGCEITSLTTVLNYWGYNIDKCDLADNFLRQEAGGGEYSIYEAFLGSPYEANSFGCYAPVIEQTAKKYLSCQPDKMEVEDLTGEGIKRIYNCVSEGFPVIVWSTMSLHDPEWTIYWTNKDGTQFKFPSYEHCMVLTGYDENENTVEVCDPLKGNMTYEMDKFEKIYVEMGRQAVLLYK